jgi:peroxiredoxin
MTIAIGDTIPSATLKEKTADGVVDVDIADFTKGRTVIIFAVPGAFTPTCSLNHLPGSKGVDEIAVVAVNDHHVIGAWAQHSGGEGKIRFFADGNAAYTKAIGLDIDLSGGGLGLRSKRYSMLVKDGVVQQLNIEATPGTADTSGAETLLGQL